MSPLRAFVLQVVLLALLALGVVVGAWWIGAGVQPGPMTVAAGGEQCLSCHAGMTGLSPFHNPAAIGCAACHGGNIHAVKAEPAHKGMRVVPGNLADADLSCGAVGCHPGMADRVRTALMATGRGIVAVDRFVFGEQPTPNGTAALTELGDTPADTHLRQLCAVCHLGHEKTEPAPITELSRGGGCLACHAQYHLPRTPDTHPRLTINIADEACFGCHSRSGRISTNYEGWHETMLTADQVPVDDPGYRLLQDGRVFERQPEDAHHTLGLSCIDCHTARETMGDGRVYRHQEEQVEVECTTCHAEAPPTLAWAALDDEARSILRVRYGREWPERRFVQVAKTGLALNNVFVDEAGRPVLETKQTAKRFAVSSPAEVCTRAGHERVSCQSCHSAWVPQCVGCHTQRDTDGQWLEYLSDFFAEPPTLGVRADTTGGTPRIEPFAPGMIMTLNTHRRDPAGDVAAMAAEGSFHRLFAPSVPHTVSAVGRACTSCHNDPLALGLGRGVLALSGEGTNAIWTFTPAFAAMRDGLPADAWTAFLDAPIPPYATRLDARPFNRAEQQRILRVGACLTCHAPETDAFLYDDFTRALRQVSAACKVPSVD